MALVRAATGASHEEAPAKKRKAPRPKKEKGPVDPAPKRQKASASKPTGKPVEVIDVDAPSIPKKKKHDAPKKQATMTSFFGKKPKEENGSKFPGWGQKAPEEETLDDLRAKARARQENNTANDEAIARSLEAED